MALLGARGGTLRVGRRLASAVSGRGSVLLALRAGSRSLDRSGCRSRLALGARGGSRSRGAGGLLLGAGCRLGLTVVTALERGGTGVEGSRLRDGRG